MNYLHEEIKKMKYKPMFDFDTDMMLAKQRAHEVSAKIKTDKILKANQKTIEKAKKNPYEHGKKVLGMKEEAFLEGYYDAIQELNEGSSVQDYLAHHTLAGNWLSSGLISYGVAKSKLKDNSKIDSLYSKYVNYCKGSALKPVSRDTFVKEGIKFYRQRKKNMGTKAAVSILGGPLTGGLSGIAGAISTTGGQRSEKFKKEARMIDDYR